MLVAAVTIEVAEQMMGDPDWQRWIEDRSRLASLRMAEVEVTPQNLEADRLFWRYWGTPLFNALLNAKADPHRRKKFRSKATS